MSVEPGLVLVDTSIWIEVLRHPAHPVRPLVDDLLSENRARLCAAIAAELMQGATTSKDMEAVEELSHSIPYLEGNDVTWRGAGLLSQKLRSRGAAVGLLDCYLATLAMQNRCSILSLDKHFPLIAKHSSLDVLSYS